MAIFHFLEEDNSVQLRIRDITMRENMYGFLPVMLVLFAAGGRGPLDLFACFLGACVSVSIGQVASHFRSACDRDNYVQLESSRRRNGIPEQTNDEMYARMMPRALVSSQIAQYGTFCAAMILRISS